MQEKLDKILNLLEDINVKVSFEELDKEKMIEFMNSMDVDSEQHKAMEALRHQFEQDPVAFLTILKQNDKTFTRETTDNVLSNIILSYLMSYALNTDHVYSILSNMTDTAKKFEEQFR